jgi:hypothetical protein
MTDDICHEIPTDFWRAFVLRDEIWETMRKGFQKVAVPKILLPKHDVGSVLILGVA